MRLRAPRRDEARAVLDVIVAAEVASIGRPDYTLQDVLDDWALPGLELDADVFVVGFVAQLAVAARARGRGHGRTLLLALLDASRAAGVDSAELSVAGANAAATGLYESAGMTPDLASERWQLR